MNAERLTTKSREVIKAAVDAAVSRGHAVVETAFMIPWLQKQDVMLWNSKVFAWMQSPSVRTHMKWRKMLMH